LLGFAVARGVFQGGDPLNPRWGRGCVCGAVADGRMSGGRGAGGCVRGPGPARGGTSGALLDGGKTMWNAV